MSSELTPEPSPSKFRPKSDTAFFLGLGSLGGFYLFLILALILALVIVPRWGKSDETKLLLMTQSIKEAVSHLEAASKKSNGTVVADGLDKALEEVRQLVDLNPEGRSKSELVKHIDSTFQLFWIRKTF